VSLFGKQGAALSSAETRSRLELFEEVMLPHLNAAHNLARWLARNEPDAQDLVQEAYLRAFRFFDGYRGGDGRAWILEIVRNTFRTWVSGKHRSVASEPFDEASHGVPKHATVEEELGGREKTALLRRCIELLPVEFREVLVMRELEEMSYRQIAEATGLAMGTVMSRLSRARKRLEECAAKGEGKPSDELLSRTDRALPG
jgi:RNA polymerase sigma-70 factor (ECF subfamily)